MPSSGEGAATGAAHSRLPQIDILRGVAILLVLFSHATVQPRDAGAWRPVLSYLRLLGPTGVDLFFVLSGFLVGGLLMTELRARGEIDVQRFLVRRAFKLWPAYFVFLAFVFAWLVMVERVPVGEGVSRLLPNLLHLQNYFGSPREHTWSLAIEEHFYVVLPVLLGVLALAQRDRTTGPTSWLPAIVLALAVATAVARYRAYAGPMPYNPHFATHLRLDSLAFGVLLAHYHHLRPGSLDALRRWPWTVLASALAMLVAYPALLIADRGNQLARALGDPMLYVAYGAILIVFVHARAEGAWREWLIRGPIGRSLAFVGFFSYPIYLWHIDATYPMGRLLATPLMQSMGLEARWLVAFAAYAALAITVGALLGLLVDRPALALRERLYPSRTALLTSATSPSPMELEREAGQPRPPSSSM